MVVGKGALAHKAMGDRDAQMVDEVLQFVPRLRQKHAAAHVKQRVVGFGQVLDDGRRGVVVERRLLQRLGVGLQAIEKFGLDLGREDVHRDIDQDRAGLAALGEQEGLLDDLREQVGAIDAPGPLDEGAVDFELRPVGMEVDLLVRVLAEVVGRYVAGDHHHRSAVESRIGDTRRGIGQAGTQMGEQDRGFAGGAGVAVGGMGRDLFVSDVDELETAVGHSRKERDVGVPAQTENVRDAPFLEVLDELM